MNRTYLSVILVLVALFFLGACAKTIAPSPEVAVADPCGPGQAVPLVEVSVPEDIKVIVAKGQRINFLAQAQPVDVSFQWELTGIGELENTSGRVVQYTAPQSVERENDVTITITVTDEETGCKAIDDIVIRLLPATPTLTLTPVLTATSPLTLTPSPTPDWCKSARRRLKGTADFAGDVKITALSNCTDDLPSQVTFTVSGTYDGMPDGVSIWVLVYAPFALYFPQSPCHGRPPWGDGEWAALVTLGQKGGLPEVFDVIVVLTDRETDRVFTDWIDEGCKTGIFDGFSADELEGMGLTEKDHVTVRTED